MITSIKVNEGAYVVRNPVVKDVTSIPYSIHQCSSEDKQFPAKNLLLKGVIHRKTGGYATARLCKYPQTITLRLLDDLPLERLYRVEMLQDKYKQATRIDVHVALQDEQFQLVGYANS
jgi:hypothetical protein